MSETSKFHMNDEVKLKLTKSGLKTLLDSVYRSEFEINAGNIVTMRLWECMHIFGGRLFFGCKIQFENNMIELVTEE